jgi:putative flippase GtrA
MIRYLYENSVARYLFSGGTSALALFGTLYIAGEVLDLWYLWASSIAVVVSFLTSFLLQKFFTFRSYTVRQAHRQFTVFLLVSVSNLFANMLLMYLLVERAELWYMFAQLIATALIAFWSFFLYRMIFSEGGNPEADRQ